MIIGGLGSVFLSIIPSITNAVDDTADVIVDPTKENAVKAGTSIAWAIIIWILTISLTIFAFIGGVVCIIMGFGD